MLIELIRLPSLVGTRKPMFKQIRLEVLSLAEKTKYEKLMNNL